MEPRGVRRESEVLPPASAGEDLRRLMAVLEFAVAKQPEAIGIMRQNDYKFDNLDDLWQKLAFTFYSTLCEVADKAEVALDALKEQQR